MNSIQALLVPPGGACTDLPSSPSPIVFDGPSFSVVLINTNKKIKKKKNKNQSFENENHLCKKEQNQKTKKKTEPWTLKVALRLRRQFHCGRVGCGSPSGLDLCGPQWAGSGSRRRQLCQGASRRPSVLGTRLNNQDGTLQLTSTIHITNPCHLQSCSWQVENILGPCRNHF